MVERNQMRASVHAKRQALEAWRQVTEVILSACPLDLLHGEQRQTILFELLHDLLVKVRFSSYLCTGGHSPGKQGNRGKVRGNISDKSVREK